MNIYEYDYSKYGGCSSSSSPLPEVPTVPWNEMITIIKENSFDKFIDVRPKAHYDIINLKNSVNIPYDQLITMSD